MPQLHWTVLCQKAPIDKYSNELSLQTVIEAINIGSPAIGEPTIGTLLPIPGTLVSFWSREDRNVPENAEARAVLIGPNGARAEGKSLLKIELQEHLRTRTLLGFPNLVFGGEGEYLFQIEMRRVPDATWEVVGEVPFDVTVTVTTAPTETQHEP